MLWTALTLLVLLHFSGSVTNNEFSERKSADSIQCQVCMATINEVFAVYYKNKSAEALRNIAVELCTTLKIETTDVCDGIVNVYLDEVVQLAELADTSTVRRLCGLFNNLCTFEDEWTVDVELGTKPQITPRTKVSATEDKLTIVHVTDMHYDPLYLDGGNADCGEPTCCRLEQGNASSKISAAGPWGDYRHCDTPLASVENTLQQITQQVPKIDFVYMTGDFVDHGVWKASQEFNSHSITKVVTAVKEAFPGVPIIFSLGNHEPVPVNQYSPLNVSSNVSSRWLYELVAELWSPYITEEAKKTILSGGYYTMKLRDGFRVIILNNVAGYGSNFWMALDSRDPYGQLKWLAETLLQAEKEGEKVHILYHVQMQSCLKTWGREFHKIVDRFENIITGQFNGHTHTDEFQVFYSLDNTTRANSVLFNGGSGTANANVNPNYRVYTVDPATLYVYNAETWVFNLTEANLHPGENPKWYQLYSFREEFGVESLTPWELESLVNRMCDDHQLIHKYSRYFVKGADVSVSGDCDDDCLKEKLCTIVTTHKEETLHCNRVTKLFEAAQSATTQPTTVQPTTQPTTVSSTTQSATVSSTAQSTTQSAKPISTTPASAFSNVPSKILLCIVLYNVFR